MGSTQKYSLKWNDFTVNVASTFRDLHSRHDFVDVTLACADGTTLEAHKVILSSVSSYFRDILKTTPCKHPIIILKDTGRDEASAMLEFAYTGEVNVAQELLPSLLHTARSFRIKGLDKVENPIEHPAPRLEAQTPSSEHWMESAPATRSHTPSSIHSQHDVKPPQFVEHFMTDKSNSSPPTNNFTGLLRSAERVREREMQTHSPPPSLPSSQPPTREASPAPGSGNSARTPPPKRWKRSFDMAQPATIRKESADQPLPLIAEDYSSSRPDYEPAKRFCEPTTTGSGCNGRVTTTMTHINHGPRSLPYPHSMPTSPTMFERGNEARLAGLFRHHLANEPGMTNGGNRPSVATSGTPEHFTNGVGKTSTPQQQAASSTTNNSDQDPLDYRCYGNQSKTEPQSENDYHSIGRSGACGNGGPSAEEEAAERYRVGSLVFRPESAPTVLDVSPECSLSGPPSVRNADLSDVHRDDEMHAHMLHNGEDLSDSVAKAFSITPDGMGRYTCDECGKIFKHPGSLQHHRHIHRGTHRCPSCGKAFSRRWDMERHLNKSKYGCPANRFSIGSAGSNNSSSSIGSAANGGGQTQQQPQQANNATTAAAHLELLAAASPSMAHNTTA